MLIRMWYYLILSTFVAPMPRPDANFRRLAAKDLQSSVLLRIVNPGTRYGCSGTYVSPNEILTAAHCLAHGSDKVFARGPSDPIGYRVRLERVDRANDLALLKAPLAHPFVKLGASPRVGEEVMNIGSPMIFEFAVSEGIVSALNFTTHEFGGEFIITTAMINPGSSGGGAFNKKGQLIGVNTRSVGMFGWSGISLAVDVKTIREFLND